MKPGYWLVAVAFVERVQGADLLSAFAQLPACGVQCFASAISSSSCTDITDGACICADTKFHDVAQECILDSCSVLEGLKVAKIEAEACDRPVRSRRAELLIPLTIEIPAFLCPWLRVYSRWSGTHEFALDDYLMLVCGILYTVFLTLGQIIGQTGLGVDTWTMEPSAVTTALKLFYIDETFYLTCLCLTKVSMLFFYLRIFPNSSFWYATYAAMAVVIIPTIIFIFLQIFQCVPVSYIWEGWVDSTPKHKCFNINTLAYAAAGFSIAQDLLILVLPLPLLYKLNTSFKSKMGVMLMFSLGIFVLVTSCVRLRYIVSFGHTKNPTWDYADPLIWSGLEVAVSVIVACLPAIRVLLNRLMPGIVMSIGSHNTANGYIKNPSSSGATTSRTRRLSRRGLEQDSQVFMSENESQIELGLRLGDKERGEVETEIIGGEHDSAGTGSGNGIRVMTTTTTAVDGTGRRIRGDGGDAMRRDIESRTPSL